MHLKLFFFLLPFASSQKDQRVDRVYLHVSGQNGEYIQQNGREEVVYQLDNENKERSGFGRQMTRRINTAGQNINSEYVDNLSSAVVMPDTITFYQEDYSRKKVSTVPPITLTDQYDLSKAKVNDVNANTRPDYNINIRPVANRAGITENQRNNGNTQNQPDNVISTNLFFDYGNTQQKTTKDNEVQESSTVKDDRRPVTKTTVTPNVDDRAAFVGDTCPTGKVRINGRCVETD